MVCTGLHCSAEEGTVEYGKAGDHGSDDIADCGKLFVCNAMAKTENTLTSEEKAITQLFEDLEVVNPNTAYAEYQLAALTGTFGQPSLCTARYSRCPLSATKLGQLIKVSDF